MNCSIIDELIYDYLDGELDELNTFIIREHLNECEACRNKVSEIKQLYYELNKFEKENIELPQELDSICDNVYELCNEGINKFTVKKYFNIQKQVFKRKFSYTDLLPGSKLCKNSAKKVGKAAVKFSGVLVRQGYKMAFSRG